MSGRPTRHLIAWITAGVAVMLVALIVLLATRTPSQATSFQSPLLAKTAPVTTSATLAGTSFDLTSERGHVVVLNFFASWCGPCQSEQPQLNAFAYDQSKRANGATMVGVIFNDRNAAAATFVSSQGVTYPILTDGGGAIAASWGVASPPTTYIIDASGVVVEALVGPLTADELDHKVAKYQTASGG